MQVQLHGGKLRGASATQYENFDQQVKAVFDEATAPSQVMLPPYYPRDPILLKDWSTYLDSVRITDHHVGLVMQRLRKEKLIDNTLIIFLTDHGISHARGKQFLYDEGTHIPLIIRGPKVNQGTTRTDLVEHIDVAAVSLAAANIEIPKTMQGQNLLAPDFQPKQAIFAARDRCGEAVDQIRSVRSERYLYIKNFYPQRPHLMPSTYKDGKLIIQRLRELHMNQRLSQLSEKLLFAPTRAAEELYLYGQDKWQTINLADDPQYSQTLAEHRQRLDQWIEETNDPGPETLEVYTLETEDQMKATKNKTTRESYRANTELYKRWAQEGN
jgi:arylsulfatase A-like enzyme